MFRIVCDPSSGNKELCLTEITGSGSQIFVMCLVGVWQRNFWTYGVCVCVRYDGLETTSSQTVVKYTHDKYLWITTSNFSQAQIRTPWWWITFDPKNVGVILILCLLTL